MSFDALYFNRRAATSSRTTTSSCTRIRTATPVRSTIPNSLFLGYDYFGYSENPGSNFVIGTLAGGERNFQGLEFVFRKRFAEQLADADVVQLERRQGQHQLRLERRLPGRRDLPGSARAEPVRDAARPDSPPAEGRRVVHVPVRPAAGRHVHVELGHGGQPHVPGVGPQPAVARDRGGGVLVRGLHQPLAGAPTRSARSPTRRGARSTCGRSTTARSAPSTLEFFVDLFNVAQLAGRGPRTRTWWPVRAARRSATRFCGSTRAAPSSARA